MMMLSPSTYVAGVLFTAFMGFIYLLSLVDLSERASTVSATEKFLAVFWIPVLFLVPILTMRSFADEKKSGVLDALMTTPVSIFQIVAAKFAACYLYYVLLWSITLVFPLITLLFIPHSAVNGGVFSLGETVSGYLFIFISGLSYVAIGVFASSLTRTTLVAAMLSFCMLFCVLIGGGLLNKFYIPESGSFAWFGALADYMQTFKHLEDFGSAMLDTRPFFYYSSICALFLAITTIVMDIRR